MEEFLKTNIPNSDKYLSMIFRETFSAEWIEIIAFYKGDFLYVAELYDGEFRICNINTYLGTNYGTCICIIKDDLQLDLPMQCETDLDYLISLFRELYRNILGIHVGKGIQLCKEMLLQLEHLEIKECTNEQLKSVPSSIKSLNISNMNEKLSIDLENILEIEIVMISRKYFNYNIKQNDYKIYYEKTKKQFEMNRIKSARN